MPDEIVDQKILGEEPKKWFTWKKKFLVLILLILAGYGWFQYGTMKTVELTIANTDSKDGIFLIFTDLGTFKNVDSYPHLKFRSSDVQGKAAPGTTVMLTYYGIRNGLMSAYPNVLDIEKINTDEKE